MVKVIQSLWRAGLSTLRFLGLSNSQINRARSVGHRAWHLFLKVRLSAIRLIQNILGIIGISISSVVSREELQSLISRMRPVANPFALRRIGGESDGGYLLPDDLHGLEACFSPGVANTASFEMELARTGVHSFLVDFSVDGPPVSSDMLSFEKLFLGTRTDDLKYIRLEDWVSGKAPGQGDLVLQMDIEGAEWPVLLDTPDQLLERFRIMVIEFHNLDQMMVGSLGATVATAVLDKLERAFKIVHIHPNNAGGTFRHKGETIPRVLEVSFLRSDRFGKSDCLIPVTLPHSLDRPNISGRDIDLSGAWSAEI